MEHHLTGAHPLEISLMRNFLTAAWPPRSPDLTHMDYFVWGFIKSNVYVKNYHSLDDLKNSINAAFQKITEVMISSTLENFVRRLNFVVERSGGHIENI